jgi:glutamyl-tRNA reductase
VDLAVSIFMDLAGKTVLVVGSGKMGSVTLRNLRDHGVGRILLTNRSPGKAEALAAEHGAGTIPYEQLRARLHEADIVITSTGSPEPILHKADFHEALRQRGQSPMFVIDIAIPRDVAQDANDLDDLYIYDIDGLQEVTEANLALRRKAVGQALEIIDAGVEQFVRWQQSLVAEPTIVSMSAELNAIRERELEKTLRALPDLTDEQRDEIAYLSKRIVNNILQRPMSQLKHEVAGHDAPHTVLHLVKRLFGLKEIT